MSEYADISIKNLSLAMFRNYVDDYVVGLFFSSADLRITPNCKIDLEDEESDEYTQYEYRSTVKKAKERLDAQGYGISKLEKIFNTNLGQAIDYSAFFYHLGIEFDEREEKTQERIKTKVSFKKWKNAMRKIISYELENGNLRWYEKTDKINIRT